MKTPAEYTSTVTKMIENHGHLMAADVASKFAWYIERAYDEGMHPARCASNITKKYEVCV